MADIEGVESIAVAVGAHRLTVVVAALPPIAPCCFLLVYMYHKSELTTGFAIFFTSRYKIVYYVCVTKASSYKLRLSHIFHNMSQPGFAMCHENKFVTHAHQLQYVPRHTLPKACV